MSKTARRASRENRILSIYHRRVVSVMRYDLLLLQCGMTIESPPAIWPEPQLAGEPAKTSSAAPPGVACEFEKRTQNLRANRVQWSRELAGRRAAVGYSAVVIAATE